MLEIIASAQSRLESDLVDRLTGLRRLSDVIGELPLEDDPTRNIVFIVGQAVLFGPAARSRWTRSPPRQANRNSSSANGSSSR